MNIEDEVLSYLRKLGNTRESDLINWEAQRYSYTNRGMKKAIRRMLESGKIRRIVHSQLKSPGVYLALEEQTKKEDTKVGLIQRLIAIRETYSEIPRLVLVMSIMMFFLIALGPPIIDEFSSVNMTSWNFTGHEVVKVVFPSLPFVLIIVWVIGLFGIGLDIAEILQKSKEATIRTMRKQM